ncbi:chaperone [Aureococcus anophagefferens]|nr:chaperone [Aureococcus anophagefferens]
MDAKRAADARHCDRILAAPSFYDVLEVSRSADEAHVRKCYLKVSLRVHPDRNADPRAKAAFQRVAEAYETLAGPAGARRGVRRASWATTAAARAALFGLTLLNAAVATRPPPAGDKRQTDLDGQPRAAAPRAFGAAQAAPTRRKRFYDRVAVAQAPAGWCVTLDGRRVPTPAGRPLAVPSLRLALALAAEWDAQATHVEPATMPLASLAATAVDQPEVRAAQEARLARGRVARGRGLDARGAEAAARVEETANIDRWGLVEGAHDYDLARIQVQLASASFFADAAAPSAGATRLQARS